MMTFNGRDKKTCMAKTAFMYSLIICLVKIILSGVTFGDVTFEPVDYSGMALFLSPLGATYWGRAKTKADENA